MKPTNLPMVRQFPMGAKPTASLSAQRGLVLLISLIVLIAMSLAAIALVRSVDTATQITGNLSFRGGSVQESDQGVEAAYAAVKALTQAQLRSDYLPASPLPPANYFASVQATNDTALVNTLTTLSALPQNAATGNTVTFMVERMCKNGFALDADSANCSVFVPPPPKTRSLGSGATPPPGDSRVYYRATVMVTGQRGTRVFTQTIFYIA